MFFRKRSKESPTVDSQVRVQTIPADFYGGANPVIKYKNVVREIGVKNSELPTAKEKELLDKQTAAGGDSSFHPANLLMNRKFLFIAGVLLFVIFFTGAGVYYWLQLRQENRPSIPPPTVTPMAVEPPTASLPEALAEETAETVPEPPSPPSLEEPRLVFPSRLLSDSADMDNDDVSDMAEEVFQTDPGVADSDSDKYGDGHEIFNLYNPTGKEPIKLIDSNLVKEFTNPVFGYSVYYPSTWALGNTDQSYRDVLFSTLTGEYIEIRAADKEANQTFADWFALRAPDQQYGELKNFASKFGESGFERGDFLVYYFPFSDKVYSIIYHTTDSNTVNYRIVAKMMARSFRISDTAALIPAPLVEENLTNRTESAAAGGEIATSSLESAVEISTTTEIFPL